MLHILIGPSFSGKSTIERYLVEKQGYKRIRSATTRKKREDEPNDAYYFISHEDYDVVDSLGEFAQKSHIGGERYGIYITELGRTKAPFDFVVVLSPEGAKDVINEVGRDKCMVYYVYVDDKTRYLWAKIRGETDESIRSRKDYDYHVMRKGREVADVVLTLDDIQRIKDGGKI